MTERLRRRILGAALALALSAMTAGCSNSTPAKKKQTPAEVQTQIDKVQNDPRIPDTVKGQILGQLQHEKQLAQQGGPRG
ncbi:MAG: hypothetical protein KGJ62_15580 [Armatimonadetes bacterium]|nr:hypothetical protein [Armatimonadota bacterium]MDE2206977.1 hypothetical protein [Armatimonadota bacterium]